MPFLNFIVNSIVKSSEFNPPKYRSAASVCIELADKDKELYLPSFNFLNTMSIRQHSYQLYINLQPEMIIKNEIKILRSKG